MENNTEYNENSKNPDERCSFYRWRFILRGENRNQIEQHDEQIQIEDTFLLMDTYSETWQKK